MMVKNQLLKNFNWIKKVWQNAKNERGGSRKTNESRSIDSEVFELPLASRRSSFVLEPDYAIVKRLRLMSQSFFNKKIMIECGTIS